MKRLAAIVILCAPCLMGAQQIALPPSSVQDGVINLSAGKNSGAEYWGGSKSLGAYRISGNGYQSPLHPGSMDRQLGLTWDFTAPTTLALDRQSIHAAGGTVRAIYIGETAGWKNDFGYTYSGNPSGPCSYTAWSQIQSTGVKPSIRFGDYFDVSLDPGEMADFDFWLSATGVFGSYPTSLTRQGGLYTVFDKTQSSSPTNQFLWASSTLAVNTWIPASSSSTLINTYLIGVEDMRANCGADGDYNDLLFALQFLNTDKTANTTIPEPNTWAAIAGLLALGFVAIKRIRARQT